MVAEHNPDLVGIHCKFTAYGDHFLEVAEIIKEGFPDTLIVIGSARPAIEGDSILKSCQAIDYVVKDDGELVLANLVKHLRGEIPIEDVHGLVYRTSNENIVGGKQHITNNAQPLMKDLNELPIPSKHEEIQILQPKNYLVRQKNTCGDHNDLKTLSIRLCVLQHQSRMAAKLGGSRP